MQPEFEAFQKIPRYFRDVSIQEKIDGTNAQVYISEDLSTVLAGSRTRWITPEDDNFGFAKWVEEHKEELKGLGPGRHFGEWYGKGIQRNYGLEDRRFMLFNTSRWNAETPPPECCQCATVLDEGLLNDFNIAYRIERLREYGSFHVPGFMRPEGVVIYHKASGHLYKVTLEKDDEYKGKTQ